MNSLSQQIFNRLAKWRLKNPSVTQRQISQYLNISESFLSEVLNGKKSLSDENTDKLLTLTKCNGIPCKRLSSLIVLGPKSNGARLSKEAYEISASGEFRGFSANNRETWVFDQTNSGWVAGGAGKASGKEAKTSIVDCPIAARSSTGNTLLDVIQTLNGLERVLADYVDVNGLVTKAKVNANGATHGKNGSALSKITSRIEHLQKS